MTTPTSRKADPPPTLKTLTPSDGFLTLRKIDQGGALQARKLSTCALQFYWRYTDAGKTYRVPIGVYDASAPPKSLKASSKGFSVAAAAEACSAKAKIQTDRALQSGYREHVAEQKVAHAAVVAQRVDAQKHSLTKLLAAYVNYLKAEERRSWADVQSMFRLHVQEAWPTVATKPAANVKPDDLLDIFRKLIEANKGRTSNKLRAYIRAAYQCALDVHSLPSIPVAFKAFRITVNPAALTRRVAKHDKADKNPLSEAEIRTYWRAVKKLPGIKGAALRLHLLSGGQRIEQLVNVKNSDAEDRAICIYDIKGRPGGDPRRHIVPLLPPALAATKELRNDGTYLVSTDGGETHLSAMTLSNWAREAAADIPDFQLKRVRSGIETLLAAAGVSKDIRGHLQSHGLSGVQAKHYDDHDYLPEKRKALEVLFVALQSKKRIRV